METGGIEQGCYTVADAHTFELLKEWKNGWSRFNIDCVVVRVAQDVNSNQIKFIEQLPHKVMGWSRADFKKTDIFHNW